MNFIKAFIAFWLIKIISLFCGEGWGEVAAQQDAQYNQYMFNPLALNPATAGSRDVLAVTLLSHNQWTGIKGAPKTSSFSFQMPLRKKRIGVGGEIISDRLGPKNVSSILFSYAYRIPLSKGKLSFGLRMGMYRYVFDWGKMDYKDLNDQYYVNNPTIRTSKITGTGDFGMYYYTRTFYWGLCYTHLNQGKIIDFNTNAPAKQAIHFFMPISKAFEVGNTVINPVILLKGASNTPGQADISVNILLKERWWLGVSARTGYGMVFLTQYRIRDNLKVGYSLDYGMNKIGTIGKTSHEIMIGYDFNVPGTKMIIPRYL